MMRFLKAVVLAPFRLVWSAAEVFLQLVMGGVIILVPIVVIVLIVFGLLYGLAMALDGLW